jgi:hypothetical protein
MWKRQFYFVVHECVKSRLVHVDIELLACDGTNDAWAYVITRCCLYVLMYDMYIWLYSPTNQLFTVSYREELKLLFLATFKVA